MHLQFVKDSGALSFPCLLHWVSISALETSVTKSLKCLPKMFDCFSTYCLRKLNSSMHRLQVLQKGGFLIFAMLNYGNVHCSLFITVLAFTTVTCHLPLSFRSVIWCLFFEDSPDAIFFIFFNTSELLNT